MAIFRPKPWVNPFGKMSIFRLFEILDFIEQKVIFLLQNIEKDIFLAYIAYKKKVGKMATFRLKPWVNSFGKMSIFRLLELPVFIAQKVAFSRKRYFPGLYCLKTKVEKMAIFKQKPWVNPFGKISIFRLFELVVFIAQKGVFSLQNIVKDIFLAYIA